ncbi:NOP5/NOP56 family protein [Methanoregula sp.]|uniref:NOP5/NOP56 family protein n=1 Tax=Methanoregula sp. TaxID=2052170 RepID=UPI002D0D36F0|nr:NOP5/NOP56 family protein [Methanoregula sp.]HVP97563.1 NOP5/NOP56 family protein [Methanoregula sp.]
MQSCWFGDVDKGTCSPFTGDAAAYARRVREIRASTDVIVPVDWHQAVACGVCHDRAEYLALLQKVCIAGSEQTVKDQYASKDVELLQMVRTLDEMDTVINLLSERVADWYQIRHPAFSRKYRRTPANVLVRSVSERSRESRGGGALGKVATGITSLADTRTALAKEVSARACEVMPNTSALIGGLVAARLLSQAGGLKELSRLPASAIQVLGARTALFAHIRTKAPAPKHGIIFQHRRVHNAPREVRGKVSRVLAGKLAIAARLDYYRGCLDPAFIEDAQARIDRTGAGPEDDQV